MSAFYNLETWIASMVANSVTLTMAAAFEGGYTHRVLQRLPSQQLKTNGYFAENIYCAVKDDEEPNESKK
jgi:hypothetical protein